MRKIKLENTGDMYYRSEGKTVTETIDGKTFTGILVKEHPNFDPTLVKNEHYYGEIQYYLLIND